ncbi:hypothetical protein [Pseudomonas protegens]|uniref:hypothetical protein n=1 Tax=Pseudomonas protegens TaxID=380021 RepID=UPI0015E8AC9F|nr:hypothetical protein [Pseudomonas protegens]
MALIAVPEAEVEQAAIEPWPAADVFIGLSDKNPFVSDDFGWDGGKLSRAEKKPP